MTLLSVLVLAVLALPAISVTLPVPSDAVKKLAQRYSNPELGTIQIRKKSGKVYFHFAHWNTEMALRKNEDGTQSYITINPGKGGFEFVRDDKGGKSALILRDAQHEYRFEKAT